METELRKGEMAACVIWLLGGVGVNTPDVNACYSHEMQEKYESV